MAAADSRREPWLARWRESWRATDSLLHPLRSEALLQRPIAERHRLVFYLGHLEAFDWNIVGKGALQLESFDPEFDRLFAFGIDPLDRNLPDEPPSFWPNPATIQIYNREVRARLAKHLAERLGGPQHEAIVWALEAVIEHRLMHAETCVYMMRGMAPEEFGYPDAAPTAAAATPPPVLRRVEIPAGTATLGKARAQGFGWDNEFEPHAVSVPGFEIDVFPVSNGQYLEFVAAGGYEQRSLWPVADWEWIQAQGIRHPRLWRLDGLGWSYRRLQRWVALPRAAPVYVSHAEASAYARWAGARLPSEAEWHRAAYGTWEGGERAFPWGDEAPSPRRGNFDFAHWDATPVHAHPDGASAFGVYDLLGNGWEWTGTPFAPLPGFRAFDFYPGYSAEFFDGRHFVLKGGGPRTAAPLLRRSFRNWFQPHYPHVDAKFRLVRA